MSKPVRVAIDPDSPTFDTPDQAAHALSEKFGGQKDTETAGVLFKTPEGKYRYSTGIPGSDDKFALAAVVPNGHSLAGIVHTHPGKDSDGQVFSPDDLQQANQLKLPSYIRFLNDGSTRKYTPGVTSTYAARLSGMSMAQKVAKGDALQLPDTITPSQPTATDQPTQQQQPNQLIPVSGSQLSSDNSSVTDPSSGGAGSSFDLSSLLGNLLSAGGTGLAASNQQQAYNGLQSALNTIGPTSLNGFSLGGPGGMSSGYNPTNGTGGIDLGSLNPAFAGLSGAAAGGASSYNPGLLSALTGNASGTLGAATGALGSAYGNYGAGMGAANTQLNNLGDFSTNYNNLLSAFRSQSAPGIQQSAYGLQNTLFGNGTLDSTGAASGSLAAQNFGRGVAQADSSNQLNAFTAALGQQNSAANNYGTLTNSANGILSNAFSNFGNTNQLISGLNSAQLNNSVNALQGAGLLNTIGLNNYNAALQTGGTQATARNQSLFPYASVAQALSGTQNGSNILSGLLTGAGSSLSGSNSSGVTGLLKSLFGNNGSNGILGNLFNGAQTSYDQGALNSFVGANGGGYDPGTVDSLFSGGGGDTMSTGDSLLDNGFSSAGGEAASSGGGSGLISGLGGTGVTAGASTLGGGGVAATGADAGVAASGAEYAQPVAYDAFSTGAGDAATTGAAADSSAGASGLSAGAGAATAIAIPAAIAYAGLTHQQTFSAGSFLKSLQGSGNNYFSPQQQSQMQDAYQKYGEDGFWQWFHGAYPGFDTANRPNTRAAVKPT